MRAILLALALPTPAFASEDIADQYPGSPLYSKPVEVIPHVWSAIGATAPPTYENTGHNNNLSFIVTGDGVVVVNGGAAYILAKALHAEIRQFLDGDVNWPEVMAALREIDYEGWISVDSVPGRTVFRISLPVAPKEAER